MNLKNTYNMTAQVIGASRYSMDGGIKGAKVQIVQDTSGDNENRLGKEVLTANAPYEIFEKLQQFSDLMPCALDLQVEMTLMAGGRAGFKVVSAEYPVVDKAVPAQQQQQTKQHEKK